MVLSKKVLVVAAHPDDEVLGCGGAVVKHIKAGDEVYIIALADGVTARIYQSNISRKEELKRCKKEIDIRKKEFFAASRTMGVKKVNLFVHNLPDQRLDAVPLLDVIKLIERLAKRISFDLVYTHHWGDLNKDHRVCCEAVLTAFRPNRLGSNKVSIFCFEISGNMNILPPANANRFSPNYFVNISSCFPVKLKAVRAYKSELRSYPHPFSPENISKIAKNRAKGKKFKFAEAYVRI